jgi:5-methylcytosine-specific restriction enzyme A
MSATNNDGWYRYRRWRKKRAWHLQRYPLCQWCDERGHTVAATVVHHAEPHRGDRAKFWHGALVSLCEQCHNGPAQILERGGTPRPTIGPDGWPVASHARDA